MAKELDYMEYANDVAAQAAYVTSDVGSEAIKVQQTGQTNETVIGDVADSEYRYAQSFTLTRATTITQVKLGAGTNYNAPAGNMTCKLETNSGSNHPSGILAHANATKTQAWTASAENTYNYTDFVLAAGTYWIVLDCDDQATNNAFRIGMAADITAGVMNRSLDGGSTWAPYATYNFTFKVYGIQPNLQCYFEPTIKQQGFFSLKAIAVITESLNDTLTRTVAPTKDLSGINTLELYVYASRTGTNIEISIHDSGGNTITISIVISSAGAWTKITKDISAVADADKDNIDEIKIEIIEAGAENTFYVDNFYGVEVAAYPVARLNKNRITGYHCFMDQYLRASRLGLTPLKLPDGTVF